MMKSGAEAMAEGLMTSGGWQGIIRFSLYGNNFKNSA